MLTATLTTGYWVYVCPCGCVSQVGYTPKKDNRYLRWCFSCQQWGGKYYQVMDEDLKFGTNPNNLLNCPVFPMIRLNHPVKNAVGSIKHVYIGGKFKGTAKIIYRKTYKATSIPPDLTILYGGCWPDLFVGNMKKQLKDKKWINWETQDLDYILLEYQKSNAVKQQNIFSDEA